jgi:NAD(P)-dependent dehydrogenase (short-subunit alcohol dehydrogenase family)
MELTSRVVLLTGARRIGAVVAAAAAARGADIVLTCNRSRREADGAAADVRALGRRALVLQADVSDASAWDGVMRDIAGEFGRLDVVVAMASRYQAVPFNEVDPAEWDRQMAVDLRGTFLVARAAVPLLRQSGGGRIITFTDWVAASARPRYKGYLSYYVAKAGVKALTEALALELAPDNILVNAIAPGPILAPPGTTAEEHAAIERSTPLGRWGGPQEIAKAVLALIDSDFITGETVRVDGGRHLY